MIKNLTNVLEDKPNILRAGIISLVLVIPLFPKFPILNVPGTYVAIRTEDFVIAFFGLVFLAVVIFKFKYWIARFWQHNIARSILIYLFVGLVSLASALLITNIVKPHLAFLQWLRRVEYFLPFFIVLLAISKNKEIFLILFLFIVVGLFTVAYGVGQIYFGFPVISTTNEEFSKGLLLPLEGPVARVNSTFAGQYDLGAFLAIILAISLAFIFSSKPDFLKSLKTKFVLILSGISFYWLLLQTGSRISFVAFLVGAITVLILLKKKLFIIPLIVLSFVSMFIFSAELSQRFLITIEQGTQTIRQKIVPQSFIISEALAINPISKTINIATQSATEATKPALLAPPITAETEPPAPGEPADLAQRIIFRSGGIRFKVEWPRAIRAFLKNPILGTGYSSIGLATDNDYLRALGETGFLGFAAFLTIILAIFKNIWDFFKKKVDEELKVVIVAISGGILALLTIATFIDIFEASKIATLFWLLIGVLVVTIEKSHASYSENK